MKIRDPAGPSHLWSRPHFPVGSATVGLLSAPCGLESPGLRPCGAAVKCTGLGVSPSEFGF